MGGLAAIAALVGGGLGALVAGLTTLDADPDFTPRVVSWGWSLGPAATIAAVGVPLALWWGKPPPSLALSVVGIAVGGRQLAWSEVVDADADADGVRLYTDGEPVRIPTGRQSTADAQSLAALCRALSRAAREGEAPALLAELRGRSETERTAG